MKTRAALILGGIASLFVLGSVSAGDDQDATATAKSTVEIKLLLGPGKTHSVAVTLGQTAREVVKACHPAKGHADDDPWVAFPAAAGGSYVLLFASEGPAGQLTERLDPSRDTLYAVLHYPSESQEKGTFLLPANLSNKSCGEIVTLKVPTTSDKARALTVALGLSTADVMQLFHPATDRAQGNDAILFDSIYDRDRYLLVFVTPDGNGKHDPKSDKLSEVIYWQAGSSTATYLLPRAKRGDEVPSKYRALVE